MKTRKIKKVRVLPAIANEPVISYDYSDFFSRVIALLGGQRIIKHAVSNQFDWIDLIRNGLPGKAINILAKNISFSDEEISTIIHVSSRSLQRWNNETRNKILDKEISSKTVELAKLFSKGESVFGSIHSFTQWLRLNNSALENKKPIDLLDTTIGFEIINDELSKIEYGIFA